MLISYNNKINCYSEDLNFRSLLRYVFDSVADALCSYCTRSDVYTLIMEVVFCTCDAFAHTGGKAGECLALSGHK